MFNFIRYLKLNKFYNFKQMSLDSSKLVLSNTSKSSLCVICNIITDRKCGRCKRIYYCSDICQINNREIHQAICIASPKQIRAKGQTNAAIFIEGLLTNDWDKLTVPILADFGFTGLSEDNQQTLFYLYQIMVLKNVGEEKLHGAFLENSLDILINDFYKDCPTSYYKRFISEKIIIGKTNLLANI